VTRPLLVGAIVIGLLGVDPTFAQQPSTEDIVKTLVPTKTLRGPRGLSIRAKTSHRRSICIFHLNSIPTNSQQKLCSH
jgi:hypothetical protein